MTPLAWIGLILGIAGMICGVYALVRDRRPAPLSPSPRRQEALAEAARAAGVRDVFQGWITWAASWTEDEYDDYWGNPYAGMLQGAYRDPSPFLDNDQQLQHILDQHPRAQWGIRKLREYMKALQAHQQQKGQAGFIRAGQISDRLRVTAAIITDLRDDTYDPGSVATTATWAYHQNPVVRAAYIAGRSKGTEDIMDAVTHARTRSREIDAAGKSIAAASERHAAALRALRETNRITESRDAHADFDRKLHD